MSFAIFILLIIYLFPSLVGGNKKNAAGIFVLNLFLGWTFVGWVISLVWACSGEKKCQD